MLAVTVLVIVVLTLVIVLAVLVVVVVVVIIIIIIIIVLVVVVVVAAQLSYLLCAHSFRISHNKTNQKSEEIFPKIRQTRINFEGRRELKTHTEFWSQILKQETIMLLCTVVCGVILLKTLSHKYVVTVFWTHLFQYSDRELSFCVHGDEY